MPLMSAAFFTVVNATVTVPVESAVAVNDSTTALYAAPAVANTSKRLRTVCPFRLTLKSRLPATVQ